MSDFDEQPDRLPIHGHTQLHSFDPAMGFRAEMLKTILQTRPHLTPGDCIEAASACVDFIQGKTTVSFGSKS